MASRVPPPTASQKQEIDKARDELGEDEAEALKKEFYKARHWNCLERYLFGGPVLLPLGKNPKYAVDPKTNPAVALHMPGFVYTQDEHDEENPYKRFPDKEYLRLLAYYWIHEPILFVPKSRQLMVTWLFCAIASHELVCRDARRTAMLSKKFEDADGLLQRVKLICEQLPRSEFPVPQVESKSGFLSCEETNSMIMAIGENSGKGLRSYTFSWIFADEFAFQEEADEQYRAALATIKGVSGMSRYTAVSTSDGEDVFYEIVSDSGKIPVPAGK